MSLARLLALVVGVVVLGTGVTAIALAASGGGPVPPAKPLDQAARDAVNAPPVAGVTARIKFTNHLLGSSGGLEGSSPILSGASGRLWLSRDGRARLELQSSGGDTQVVYDRGRVWAYDASSNTVYRGTLQHGGGERSGKEADKPVSLAGVQKALTDIARHADVSSAIPGHVGGRPVYTVRVSPKRDGGLVGAGELAWDAVRGIPLRFAVYAAGNESPVLELEATNVSYGPVAASAFDVSPPTDAKSVEVARPASSQAGGRALHRERKPLTGSAAVAKALPFPLVAPASLGDLARQDVKLLDWHGSPAALVTYGHGLGGIAVIEQAAGGHEAGSAADPGSGEGPRLPEVSVNGTSAQEIETALGTLLRFTRGKVGYTVVGFVTPVAAVAAARALTR